MYCRNSTVSSKWCTLVTRMPGSLSTRVWQLSTHPGRRQSRHRTEPGPDPDEPLTPPPNSFCWCGADRGHSKEDTKTVNSRANSAEDPPKSEQTGYRVVLLSCQTQKQTSRTTASTFSHHLKRSSQYMISTANSHQSRSYGRKIRTTVRWRHPRW